MHPASCIFHHHLMITTALLLIFAGWSQMVRAVEDCPADYSLTTLRSCTNSSGANCDGEDHLCLGNRCCAFRPPSVTFQSWAGSSDEEVIAVEPLKECDSNNDCNDHQFCDIVFSSSAVKPYVNDRKIFRKVCYRKPTLVGEISAVGKTSLKLCNYPKDCGKLFLCYPLARQVHDSTKNMFLNGICTKIIGLTEYPYDNFGDPCERSRECTADMFKINREGLRGCKVFDSKSPFLSPSAGLCLRAKVQCLNRMDPGQPSFSINGTVLCPKGSQAEKNSELGEICCPKAYSYHLYWASIDEKKKLPSHVSNTGSGQECNTSRDCGRHQFCDDLVNSLNGVGAKDGSGPGGSSLRFCFTVPVENHRTYNNNEKQFCSKDNECTHEDVCRILPIKAEAPKETTIGFCAEAPTSVRTTFKTSTSLPKKEVTPSRPVDSSDPGKDKLIEELTILEKECRKKLANIGGCPQVSHWPIFLLALAVIILLLTNIASLIYIAMFKRKLLATNGKESALPTDIGKTHRVVLNPHPETLVVPKTEKAKIPRQRKIRKPEVLTSAHRDYIVKRKRQEKEDARSDKFIKKGPIKIPTSFRGEVEVAQEKEDNITIEKVYYDEKLNEIYDIGTDVDLMEEASEKASAQGKTNKSSAPQDVKAPEEKKSTKMNTK